MKTLKGKSKHNDGMSMPNTVQKKKKSGLYLKDNRSESSIQRKLLEKVEKRHLSPRATQLKGYANQEDIIQKREMSDGAIQLMEDEELLNESMEEYDEEYDQ